MKSILVCCLSFLLCIGLTAHANDFQPRVVDGNNTTPYAYPSFVTLSIDSNDKADCGGTLISRDWVLTAAHCLRSGGYTAPASRVKVGINPIGVFPVQGVQVYQWINAIAVHIHSQFNFPQYDIALIQLSTPVSTTSVRLNDIDGYPTLGDWATVVGLGMTNRQTVGNPTKGSQPLIVQKADLPITSGSCTGTLICAGFDDRQNHPDGCTGDSGGPLYTTRLGETIQVGIVSGGFGCGVGYAGGYTDVKQFKSYIQSYVTDARFLSELPLFADSFE